MKYISFTSNRNKNSLFNNLLIFIFDYGSSLNYLSKYIQHYIAIFIFRMKNSNPKVIEPDYIHIQKKVELEKYSSLIYRIIAFFLLYSNTHTRN